MSLLGKVGEKKYDGRSDEEARRRLTEALFHRLDARTISRIVGESRERAYREVDAALWLELESSAFADVPADRRASLVQQVANGILGFGPLEELLGDPTVTEIMVNGPDDIFYERDGVIHPSDIRFEESAVK